ncbi:MAG: glycosyltransferase [Actinomycetia bacterium]|nr:glycosyltransferase [Actinomycetes bacterium]
MTGAEPSQYAVTVAVCTFRRNDLLTSLVQTVAALAANEVPDGAVRLLIVDDSPESGAAEVVDNLRHNVAITLDYFASAAADISIARNHALQLGAVASDFLACLDDDCVPNPGWLRELLRIADANTADVVVGHRQFVAAPNAPRWLSEQPFLAENLHYVDGSVPTHGNTANMLVRSSWLQSSRVRFRSEMGTAGGEDMVFFSDAANAGANIRFAANSICDEPCGGKRATLRYQLWRQFWLGNNEAVINAMTHHVTRLRLAARASKRILAGATHPLRRLLRRQAPQWRWAVALTGSGVGLLVGVAGVHLRHRSF